MSFYRTIRQRWTSGMSAALGLLLGFITIFAVPASVFFAPSIQTTDTGTGERWACPMLDFIGTKPGSCPVCGMTLHKVTAGELSREQAKRMGVQLAAITSGPALTTIHAYGAVRYDDRREQVVIARVAGRIIQRHGGTLHPGTTVAVGDTLLDLYSPEVFAAQGELAAALRLGDQRLSTAITERFARWNLSHVADAIRAGQAPSDTISIRSPFAGRVVMNEDANKGEALTVGSDITADRPIVRLVDPVTFMVVIHVPEPQARMLRSGEHVQLASDDAGELPEVNASVSWVAPELNPEIRAREVHLHLHDPQQRLLPGSLVHARIRAVLGPDLSPADPNDEATWGHFPLIPASAVLSTGVRNVAWKLDKTDPDGRQHFVIAPLALGQRLEDADGNDRFVVRAGLKDGDQVATQGAFLIDSQAQLAGTPSLLFPLGANTSVPTHSH